MSELPDRPLLRVDEVALFFNASRQAVYLWIEHGHLKAQRRPGGSIQGVMRDSVIRWAEILIKRSERLL